MHGANTLMANVIPYARRLALGAHGAVPMASPPFLPISRAS